MNNEWNAGVEVSKRLARLVKQPDNSCASYIGKYNSLQSNDDIEISDLENALIKAAQLTHELDLGTEMFKRLEQALEDRKKQQSTMDKILMLAGKSLADDTNIAY